MFQPQDERFMQTAIDASVTALQAGDMPFGAVLVSAQGEGLLVARNNQVTSGDCTGHAEMVLVREATRMLGAKSMEGATVYASGEPCAMCSGAMFWAKIQRVVYAATTQDIADALGTPKLTITSSTVLAHAVPAMQVQGPLLQAPAVAVLKRLAQPASEV
jgi:tRNA(adenine34) deaminase